MQSILNCLQRGYVIPKGTAAELFKTKNVKQYTLNAWSRAGSYSD